MSLFDGLPEQDAYTVTIKRASNGEEIMLCSVTPPPHETLAAARQRKMPLFTLNEIEPMRRIAAADPKALDAIIATRRHMGWGGPIHYQERSNAQIIFYSTRWF